MTFYGTKQIGFPVDHNASRQSYQVREPKGQAAHENADELYQNALRENGTPAAKKALSNAGVPAAQPQTQAPVPQNVAPPPLNPPPSGLISAPLRPGVQDVVQRPEEAMPLFEAVAAKAREWTDRKQLVDVFGTRGTMKAHLEKKRVAKGELPVFQVDMETLARAARTENNPNPTPVKLNEVAQQISGRQLAGALVKQPLDGQVPFVVMKDGTTRIGAPLFAPGYGRLNHMDLSGMADQVKFAGTMQFENGILTSWNNSSGGYREHIANAHQAGLPMDLFEDLASHTDIHAKKPDLIVGGAGLRVQWGRSGKPH